MTSWSCRPFRYSLVLSMPRGRTEDCLETLARAERITESPTTLAARIDLELVAAKIEVERDAGFEVASGRVDEALLRAEQANLAGKVMEARLVRAQLELAAGDPALAQTLLEELAEEAREAGFSKISREATEASGGSARPRRPSQRD